MGWNGNVVLRCTGKTFFFEVYNNIEITAPMYYTQGLSYFCLLIKRPSNFIMLHYNKCVDGESGGIAYKSSPCERLYSLS